MATDKIQKLRWSIWQARWGIVVSSLVLIGIYIVFPLVQVASAQVAVERMAYELAPKEYPGSILVDHWRGGGPRTVWDRRIYQTPDSLENVLEFMYAQQFEFLSWDEETYRTYKCSRTETSTKLSRLLVGDHYAFGYQIAPVPCASVLIYSGKDIPSATFIEVGMDWPARSIARCLKETSWLPKLENETC